MKLRSLLVASSLAELSLAAFLAPGLQGGLQRREDEQEDAPRFRADYLPSFLAKEYQEGVDPEAPSARPEQCKNGGCLRRLPVEYHGLANPNLKPELKSGPADEGGPIAEDVGDGNYLASVPIVGGLIKMLGLDKGFYSDDRFLVITLIKKCFNSTLTKQLMTSKAELQINHDLKLS